MAIIDSFCFPVTRTDELSLFEQAPVELSSLPRTRADKRYLCLFTRALKACDDFMSQVDADASVGVLGLIPANLSPGDYWWQLQAQFSGFVLHPYLQGLQADNLGGLSACIDAGIIGRRPIFICTAVGSPKMYSIDPLKVASAVANKVSSPVVLAHAGGAKIIEAMLIADAHEHVFLETSFSLPYWLGSSVEQDTAFAIKKIGAHRFLYGSDAPFCSEQKALDAHYAFFDRHGVDADSIGKIMCTNAQGIFD
ncbi:MAG TPA: amidohydrolase family protein [Marinagarivorans sp.]